MIWRPRNCPGYRRHLFHNRRLLGTRSQSALFPVRSIQDRSIIHSFCHPVSVFCYAKIFYKLSNILGSSVLGVPITGNGFLYPHLDSHSVAEIQRLTAANSGQFAVNSLAAVHQRSNERRERSGEIAHFVRSLAPDSGDHRNGVLLSAALSLSRHRLILMSCGR